jgi:hypothetical protein
VFTHIPRTGNPVGKSNSSLFTRAGAGLGVAALTAGLALVATPAAAETVPVSYAEGQFLSGTILNTDLDRVVALAAAEAENDGTQSKQTSKDPLDAEVLQAINVQAPNGVQLDLGEFLDAGAVSQYAEADKNGEAMASSGAVGDDGAIGAGSVGSGSAGDLSVDLDALVGSEYDNILTDLTLSLDAVSAQAIGDLESASGDYRIAGATLIFTSPAIGDLTGKVNSALDGVDEDLLALSDSNGPLGTAIDDVLDPVLAVVGSSADVSVSVTSDVDAAVQSLLSGAYGNGAVRFNLQTGEVYVDLDTLLGGDLNNLAPGTELLSDAVVNQVLKGITDTVSTLSDQILDRVEIALHEAQVDVHADLDLLTAQPGGQQEVCHDTQVPIVGPLLGGLLGGTGIVGYTTEQVCELVGQVLPDLRSTVTVDIEGTVDQILNGVAAKADASVSLLGGTVDTAVNVDAMVGGLADGLADGLFDSDGTVAEVADSLNSGLVNPAVTGLLGDNSVGELLRDVISVKANVQETESNSEGEFFTQTALRVAVLDSQLATLNVASATVGPNAERVVDPGCTTNCGPTNPPTDGCIGNCDPGTGTPTPAANGGNLAFTGVGIATLVAIILALLAAGAYLAREGYRRNHPRSVTSD